MKSTPKFLSLFALVTIGASLYAAPATCESGPVALIFRTSKAELAQSADCEMRFRSIWYSNFSNLKTTEFKGVILIVR